LQLNNIDNSGRLQMSTKYVGTENNASELSLDSLEARLDWPCLIKMDVDGHEEEILKGAKALNSRCGVRWLIETHSAQLEAACRQNLSSNGFSTRVIPNAWWRLILPEQRGSVHNRWLAAWKE
jgi:hypothetical protein